MDIFEMATANARSDMNAAVNMETSSGKISGNVGSIYNKRNGAA